MDLVNSAKIGDLNEVISLIEKGADIHFNDDQALQLSASNGHSLVVEYLINNYANIYANSSEALISSASNGHLEVVKLLIQHGNVYGSVDRIKYVDKSGFIKFADFPSKVQYRYHEAISKSAKNGHLDIFTFLVENNTVGTDYGHILVESATNGHLEIVRIALNHHIDQRNYNKALCISAEKGYLEIVKLLIEHGACVRIDENYPLRFSAQNGHLEVVRLLLQKGARIHAENDYALRMSATNGHHEIVRLLLQNNAHLPSGNYGALHNSANNGHLEVVKTILEFDPNIHDALLHGIKRDEIVDFLLLKYSKEKLEKALDNSFLKVELSKYLLRNDLTKYHVAILLYREFGYDLFDLLENEKTEITLKRCINRDEQADHICIHHGL